MIANRVEKSAQTGECAPARWRRLLVGTCVFALLLAIVLALQWKSGAWRAEFGIQQPDEPAHYVTGLMIHDWVRAGFPSPLPFAKNFYAHYPKVALGWWPPLFHAIEAGWMLVFGTSRGSVMMLMALIAAGLAFAVFLAARREFTTLSAVFIAALLLSSHIIQGGASMIMLDTLVAVGCWGAALGMARFTETSSRRDFWLMLGFGAVALMAKGNALCLGLTLPLIPLLLRRPEALLRRRFWLAGAALVAVAAPFEYLTMHFHQAEHFSASWAFAMRALTAYSTAMALWFGPLLTAFGVIGIVHKLVLAFLRKSVEPLWAASGALIVGAMVFHCITPFGPDERYITLAAAPLVLFIAAGVRWTAGLLPLPQRARVPALAAVLGALYLAFVFQTPRKPWFGYGEAASYITRTPEWRNSLILDSSPGVGEGPFIAEMAMRGPRMGQGILRGRKMLSSSTWNGQFYKPYYPTAEETQAYLEKIAVDLLVVDSLSSPAPAEHHRVLREALARFPDRWQLVGTFPQHASPEAAGFGIQVYRRAGALRGARPPIHIPMQHTLGNSIVYPDQP